MGSFFAQSDVPDGASMRTVRLLVIDQSLVVVVAIFNLGWLYREVVVVLVSTLCGVTHVPVYHTL